jgi:hypothetical protein
MTRLFTERTAKRGVVVWAALVVATSISWSVGIDHGIDYIISTVLVLLVTLVKIYLVGMNFMELREAPSGLRAGFTATCVGICTALAAIYLAAG